MTTFWIWFWGLLFLVTVLLYAGLAAVVAWGGFKDILAMFRNLDRQHQRQEGDLEEPE